MENSIKLIISDGISFGPEHCKVLVTPMPEGGSDELSINAFIVDVSKSGKSVLSAPGFSRGSIALGPSPDSSGLVAGRLGLIGFIDGDRLSQEIIDGPESQGFIRDVRSIGAHLYAVGMGPQVYRRSSVGQWILFEQGIDKSFKDYLDVRGLNSIDGSSEQDMYAVGFEGEIWRCLNGRWSAIESPTNLSLECVRVVTPTKVYAAGQAGVLLRGYGDVWEVINQTATDEDFWSIELFKENVYLSTSNGLFRFANDSDLCAINTGCSEPQMFSQLHASNGALWSFGPRHLCWTEDGETWNDVAWPK